MYSTIKPNKIWDSWAIVFAFASKCMYTFEIFICDTTKTNDWQKLPLQQFLNENFQNYIDSTYKRSLIF